MHLFHFDLPNFEFRISLNIVFKIFHTIYFVDLTILTPPHTQKTQLNHWNFELFMKMICTHNSSNYRYFQVHVCEQLLQRNLDFVQNKHFSTSKRPCELT